MQSICNTKWCTIITILQGPFHLLINCEKFSLSTNLISNIANLQSFKCLRILSMGRNTLKSLQGIEGAADTLEQLWISYNQIDRLKPIRNLLRLKVNQTHLKYELLPTSECEHTSITNILATISELFVEVHS